MGEPLEKVYLFASVNEPVTTETKEIKYKKELSGGTPCKIPCVVFSRSAFVGFPKEAKSGKLNQVFVIRQNLKGKL